MRLSTDGEAFLPHARTLLAAQELALMTPPEPERELTIAISDHVAGPELPEILARVHACDPALMLKVRVNYSRNVIAQFDDGLADVAVVRRQGKRRDGELLFEDQYGWFASVGARLDGKLLPLITVTDECGVGETATRLLAAAKTPGLTHFLAAASPPRSPRPVRASACYPCPGGWRRPGWSMWAARWRFHPARRADHDARQAIRCPDHSDAARVGRGLSQRGRPALSHRASIRLVAAVDKLSRFAYFGARPRRPIVRRRNFPSR